MYLTWNQWPNPVDFVGDTADFDLFLFTGRQANNSPATNLPGFVVRSALDQTNTFFKFPPQEVFSDTTVANLGDVMCLVIAKDVGDESTKIHVDVESGELFRNGTYNFRTRATSLDTPADATNSFAVGMVNVNTAWPGAFDNDGSAGPTEHPSPVKKPEICGPSRITNQQSNTAVQAGNPDAGRTDDNIDISFVNPLHGTSAAAAVIAAGAALLLDDDRSGSSPPTLTTPALLRAELVSAPTGGSHFSQFRCNAGVLKLPAPTLPATHCGISTALFNNTIQGTSGDDKLFGTVLRDLIIGGGGNDSIVGRAGDDCLIGGAGDDRISGGEGNDVILGGPGNDSLTGREGDDTIDGEGGIDNVNGGPGTDTCTGEIVAECEA